MSTLILMKIQIDYNSMNCLKSKKYCTFSIWGGFRGRYGTKERAQSYTDGTKIQYTGDINKRYPDTNIL